MYTVKNLQERYAVSETTVLKWINSGVLKALNVGRTPGAAKPRWRVTQAALDAFELSRAATPASAAAPAPRRHKPADVIEFYA